MQNTPSAIANTPELGELRRQAGLSAETLFDHECTKRGLYSWKPGFNSVKGREGPIDRYVGSLNLILSVQIKSTNTLTLRSRGMGVKSPVFEIANHRESPKRSQICAHGIDVLAIFIAPLNRWHILPAHTCLGKRIRVYQSPNQVSKFMASIDNWSLLGTPL